MSCLHMSDVKKYILPVSIFLGAVIMATVGLLSGSGESFLSAFSYGLSVGMLVLFFYLLWPEKSGIFEDDVLHTRYSQVMDTVETLNDGFLLFDTDHRLIIINKKAHEIFEDAGPKFQLGIDRLDLVKYFLRWFETDNEKEKLLTYIQEVKQGEVYPRKGVCFRTPAGRHFILDEHYTENNGLAVIIREVTETVEKQTELGMTHSLLSTVYENIPIGICVYDADDCIISWNEKYIELMEVDAAKMYKGISLREQIRHNFHNYSGEGGDIESFTKITINRLRNFQSSHIERQMKSGKIIEIIRSNLPEGGYVCTFADVTLEKSTQQLLQESEKRYRKMVELSPDAILVHKNGIIIYANAAAVKLLEAKDRHGLVGEKIQKYFPVNDHELLSAHFGTAQYLQPGDIVPSAKSQVIGKIGNRIDVELEASALLYGDKPVMQLIARDISAQTIAQKLLQKAKEDAESAAQLKGTFLANMSHELRTPLNAVIGFSEIIKNEIYGKVGDAKYTEYATDIHASGLHLLDLINDILDLSKIESGAQELYEEPVSLTQVVEDCLRLTEHQRSLANVEIVSHLNTVMPTVVVDMRMIKQVVINLLSNAIKFTPQGGKINISCILERDGSLALSVEDTGIGIRDEDITKALTPFVQIDSELSRKYQGTGLGLPLSKNLMELHGGELTLSSEFGKGTIVTVRLPSKRVESRAA